MALFYVVFLVCNLASILSATKEEKLTKEYGFEFNLENKKDWDDYRITENEEGALSGEANGCSQRIPVIFKRLCVGWNDDHGFSFALQASHNLNIDPNYDDMLWYYSDHKTAKNADKAAQTKEASETREMPLRRRLMSKDAAQCFWYNDARACARTDTTNPQSVIASVGINENDVPKKQRSISGFRAAYDDYSDYNDNDEDYNEDYYENDVPKKQRSITGFSAASAYDDYDEDYNYNGYYQGQGYGDINDYYDDNEYSEYYEALNDLYSKYMQQQALYNQQWVNYLNNMYWQNMLQQQQQQQQRQQQQQQQQYPGYMANAYGSGAGKRHNTVGMAGSNVRKKKQKNMYMSQK